MDWSTILTAIITAVGALLGTYIANRKSAALIEYRIAELEKKQDKHNSIIERTYQLETEVERLKDEDKRHNERLKALEGK